MYTKNTSLAVSKLTALKMFWDEGFNTEELLIIAYKSLNTLSQPSKDYFYADEVSAKIKIA